MEIDHFDQRCPIYLSRCQFLGAIRFDPAAMAAAVAALLGGIVVWGSNGSTAREAAKELAAAEADRAALIEMIDLHVIGSLR